jgi:molecular chaperone DnaK (HSP70)
VANPVIGIDLGTLNSCVAVVRDGRAVVLSEDGAGTTTPSVVAFQGDRELVGEAGRRQAVTDPHSTVIAVKRLLGHPFDSEEVQRATKQLPYPVKASPLGSVLLEIDGRELTPVQVSALILQRLRELAEKALDHEVRQAVIAVPAHFNDVQRKATKLAAEYAGLEVLRLINEPTAAAFAYGYKKAQDFTLAVYDLGGGTFDVTLMKAVGDCFSVVATDGDSFLGGEDVDAAVAEWLTSEFLAESGSDLSNDAHARLRLRQAAEQAKIELADVESTQIDLPFLTQLPDGTRPGFTRALTREKLDELARPVVGKTLELCERCLQAAGVRPNEIDEVLLAGGQSRMGIVREMVREFFGREPRRDINPDEVVAIGTALYGYSLVADQLKEDAQEVAGDMYAVAVRSTDVARKVLDEVVEYEKARETAEAEGKPLDDHALEARLQQLLEATGEDDAPTDPSLSRDEDLPQAVDGLHEELLALDHKASEVIEKLAGKALEEGASQEVIEQAREVIEKNLADAKLAAGEAVDQLEQAEEHGNVRKVELRDVTSLPLGIAAAADLFMVLIDQNTTVPAEHTRVFTTNQDGQSEVEIRVLQGRERNCRANQQLGAFILEGIPPAPRMTPKIQVSFRIDEDGILSVRARDGKSGAQQSMRVEDPLGLQQVADDDEQENAPDEAIVDDVLEALAEQVEDVSELFDSSGDPL